MLTPSNASMYTSGGDTYSCAQAPQVLSRGDVVPEQNMFHPSYPGNRHILRRNEPSEPKVSLPFYTGKAEWRTFWLQFSRIAQRFGWNAEITLDRLVSSLRDDALEYFAQQPYQVQSSLPLTVATFERRFDDRRLPETYRASLQSLKKQSKESLEEYAAKVRKVVAKAYPDAVGTSLYESLCVEHLVGGLSDPSMIYDVLTKKPQTVELAMDLIQWHESCRGIQKKRTAVRQVTFEDEQERELEIRRMNGKSYVTEERLNQFGRELREGLVDDLKKATSQRGSRTNSRSQECYRCHKIGHFARACPTRQESNEETQKKPETETSDPLN